MQVSHHHTRPHDGFPARLRERLERFGSVSALALAIHRSESAVRKWLRGQSEPSVTDLRALCEVTGTRIEWLVTGKGPPEGAALLRDPGSNYGENNKAALELPLLETVIAAVDTRLSETGTTLPASKHATLIAACYDLACESNGLDTQVIARLVTLAS